MYCPLPTKQSSHGSDIIALPTVLKSLKSLIQDELMSPRYVGNPVETHVFPHHEHQFYRNFRSSFQKCQAEVSAYECQKVTHRACCAHPLFERIHERLVTEIVIPLERQLSEEGRMHLVPIAKNELSRKRKIEDSIKASAPADNKPVVEAAQRIDQSEFTTNTTSVASLLVSLHRANVNGPNNKENKDALHTEESYKRKRDPQLTMRAINSQNPSTGTRNDTVLHDVRNLKSRLKGTCNDAVLHDARNLESRLKGTQGTSMPRKARKKGVRHKSFDERFQDLLAYKGIHGNFNVPKTKSNENEHHSLAVWCDNIRQAYRRIEKGQVSRLKLTRENIQRLDSVGFQWRLQNEYLSFDDRFRDIIAFKEEHGHCNVPQRRPRVNENYRHHSLGKWCSDIRRSYRALQNGSIPSSYKKLSKAQVKQLESEGFKWNYRKSKSAVTTKH